MAEALRSAAFRGDAAEVEKLIATLTPADATQLNNFGQSALHVAVLQNRVAVVEVLARFLRGTAFVDHRTECGRSAIFLAARDGFDGCVRVLIAVGGADVESRSSQGLTSLHAACRSCRASVVAVLLEAGADVNAVDTFGRVTPLCCAAFSGCVEVVKQLLERGAAVSDVPGCRGDALLIAAEAGHAEVVQLLLSADPSADVNRRGPQGGTALHVAVQCGHVGVVKALIVQGRVDVNALSADGMWRPLDMAAAEGHIDVVCELLGADGIRISTFTVAVAMRTRNKEVAKLLLQGRSGRDLNIALRDEHSLLKRAVECRDTELVAALLDRCAGQPEVTEALNDALLLAVSGDDGAMTQRLIDRGASPNSSNSFGQSALHVAAQYNCADAAAVLLRRGAATEQRDGMGAVALHAACRSLSVDLVALLLRAGADLDAVDDVNESAVTISLVERRDSIATLLLGLGAALRAMTFTRVHNAAAWGHESCLAALNGTGSLWWYTAVPMGTTPLWIAARAQRGQVCEKLLGDVGAFVV